MGDIFTHGLFSVNLLSVLVVIGCVVGAAGMVLQVIHSVSVGESIVKMLLSVLMLIAIFSSAIWNIVKGFIQYYDFKIDRNENKLYIRYGILKKVNYTIPAEKNQRTEVKANIFCKTDREIYSRDHQYRNGGMMPRNPNLFFFRTVNEIKWKSGFAYYFLNFMKQYRCRLYGSQ